MSTVAATRAPASFWAVAVLSLLWNAFGAYDYTMTNLRDPGYLKMFPPGMIDYIDGFAPWAVAVWALGVWGALAGSLLLLARSRFAVIAFALSLAGLALSTLYQQALTTPPPVMRAPSSIAINLVIWAIAVFLLWYAARMRAAGVLR